MKRFRKATKGLIKVKKTKKELFRPKPIPIPKTEEDLKNEEADKIFDESTKGYRKFLRAKELIKIRKAAIVK